MYCAICKDECRFSYIQSMIEYFSFKKKRNIRWWSKLYLNNHYKWISIQIFHGNLPLMEHIWKIKKQPGYFWFATKNTSIIIRWKLYEPKFEKSLTTNGRKRRKINNAW